MRYEGGMFNSDASAPSMAGYVLIASPAMADSALARTVCLIMHDDLHSGSVGLVLNRPIAADVTELWSTIAGQRGQQVESGGRLCFGGPLSGPIVAVHRQPSLAEFEMGQGLYLAAEANHLRDLLQGSEDYRIFVGHVGWKPGELLSQLAAGKWHVVPVSANLIFPEDERLWDHLLRRAAGRSLAHWVGARHIPDSPLVN